MHDESQQSPMSSFVPLRLRPIELYRCTGVILQISEGCSKDGTVGLPGMVNAFSCVSRFPMTALFVRETDANRCICGDVGLAVAACVVYRKESMVWV